MAIRDDVKPPMTGSEIALGTRNHVRQTLARVHVALAETRARGEQSRLLITRSATLLESSEQLLQQSQALRAQLRASITAYVRRLHDDGVPPQRMLILVKDAIREAVPQELPLDDSRALIDEVVRWSIDAFYAA
jgi:hypothetical protein